MAQTSLLTRLLRPLLLPISIAADRVRSHFYLATAVLVMALAVLALTTNSMRGMKYQVYDLIMKSRFHYPAADPELVILDIDEASLANLAPDYGRWPWPRNVMGEVLEGLMAQRPKAVVFDIAFADPDVQNPESDKFFREAVARYPNTFFPMIRLNPDNDALSELRLAQLPGSVRVDEDAPADATVAMILPYLYEQLDGLRLGTNNLDAARDGIVRGYRAWRDIEGYRIGSLPANVAQALGAEAPDKSDVLLNFRGKPLAFHTVPLHEFYRDQLKEHRTRAQDEFAGKIIVIGSTAPSLFDTKPTSMARVHPGVDILTTALDNFKNGDYLNELPFWVYIIVTIASVAALAAAFTVNVDYRVLAPIFSTVQIGFIVVSYLFLNFSTTFVDLSAPFTFTLLYFFIARTHHMVQTQYRNGQPLFSKLLDEGSHCRLILAHCYLGGGDQADKLKLRGQLKHLTARSRHGVASTPLFRATPLLAAFFKDTQLLYWLVPEDREKEAFADVREVFERIRADDGPDAAALTVVLETESFVTGPGADWRLRGEAAVARTLARLAELAPSTPAGTIQYLSSPGFAQFCRAAGCEVPANLRAAGFAG